MAIFDQAVSAWAESSISPPRVLVLGVTPELSKLRWPTGTILHALDGSPEMVKKVWPGSASSAIVGSWNLAPIVDASQDIIVCDGGVGMLSYPDGQRRLLEEVKRMLSPGGLFAVRLFAPAGRTGSLTDIETDLKAGMIETLDALKLRLWGALQENPGTGVRPHDVVTQIEKMVGCLDWLVSELGWSAEHVATLQLHLNSTVVYHLTDEKTMVKMADEVGDLNAIWVKIPIHPLGIASPVVCFKRK